MKKRWWLWMLIGALVIGGATINRESDPEKVTTKVLTAERVEQTITCTGIVESAKATGVYLPVSCVIKEVLVKEGERVEKGDLLAVVDKQASYVGLENKAERMILAALEETVTAPDNGVVVGINIIAGTKLEMGSPSVMLALERDIQVRIGLREKDLKTIQPGMTARLFGDGFSRAVYTGIVKEIAAAVRTDTTAGTVIEGVIRLDADQADASLRLGLTARATVVTAVTESGLLVPHEAVISDGEGQYVYLLKDGCARRQKLDVVAQVAGGVLLADTSLEGQKVICQPHKAMYDGMPVEEEGQ